MLECHRHYKMSIVVVYMATTIFQIPFERSLHQTCIDSTIGVFLENECFKSFTWSNIDFEVKSVHHPHLLHCLITRKKHHWLSIGCYLFAAGFAISWLLRAAPSLHSRTWQGLVCLAWWLCLSLTNSTSGLCPFTCSFEPKSAFTSGKWGTVGRKALHTCGPYTANGFYGGMGIHIAAASRRP